MANTYTQIYIHFIFCVKYRSRLLPEDKKQELHKYITGIVQNNGHKLIIINSVPDHVHMFVGLIPTMSIADLMRDVKSNSSNLINKNKWLRGKFNWQDGYGAFSYSRSQFDRIVKYIKNQKEHHKRKTFREEYIEFLKKFHVEYDERYVMNVE